MTPETLGVAPGQSIVITTPTNQNTVIVKSILSHSTLSYSIYPGIRFFFMVTPTEWKIVVDRWKKGMRPLKIDDQQYGQKVIKILDKYVGNEFAQFDDPNEAVTFVVLIGMMKEQDKRR